MRMRVRITKRNIQREGEREANGEKDEKLRQKE